MNFFLLYFLFINLVFVYSKSTPCELRKFKAGLVCVCNTTYCDTLNNDDLQFDYTHNMIIISTTEAGLRFNVTRWKADIGSYNNKIINITDISPIKQHNVPYGFNFQSVIKFFDDALSMLIGSLDEELDRAVSFVIDTGNKYQKIEGFGSSYTGTVTHLLKNLPVNLRNSIFKSYYSTSEGIGYNMMKIPIGGSEFDLAPWAYNENPVNDSKLSNFNRLDERDSLRNRQIKELMDVTKNKDIGMVGVAYSPPPWMKTNNNWNGESALKLEYYKTWADYHLRYLDLMKKDGINFWAITTGNEPLNGAVKYFNINYLSLGWTPTTQGRWINEYLVPILRESAFKNIKIFGGDDKRVIFPWWFSEMEYANPNSTKLIDGFAIQSNWDSVFPSVYLDEAHNIFPKKMIINTEGSIDDIFGKGPVLGSWDRAQKSIDATVQNLKHWVQGIINWNLVLDLKGGPNYINRTTDAPIIICDQELFKQPLFYSIGHFSKFITPGSVRIDALCSGTAVDGVGFLRPDNVIVLVIFNSRPYSVEVYLRESINGKVLINLPAKSFHTILYKL